MSITAKIIKDSISKKGKRITTFEIEIPRYILAEFNTHRALSRNSASSRAIPIEKNIEQVMKRPVIPVHFGKNMAGMQAKEELDDLIKNQLTPFDGEGVFFPNDYNLDTSIYNSNDFVCNRLTDGKNFWTDVQERVTLKESAKRRWLQARNLAVQQVKTLAELGLHKQIANRILEPWLYTKIVATATEWDNFFSLRCHPDAQPEIKVVADLMWELYNSSTPEILEEWEWHVPYMYKIPYSIDGLTYYTSKDPAIYAIADEDRVLFDVAIKVSASMCAQLSYRKADDSIDKAIMIYDRLVSAKPVHASPFEHQACPLDDPEQSSGNFYGWLQHRQIIADHVCKKYKPA